MLLIEGRTGRGFVGLRCRSAGVAPDIGMCSPGSVLLLWTFLLGVLLKASHCEQEHVGHELWV